MTDQVSTIEAARHLADEGYKRAQAGEFDLAVASLDASLAIRRGLDDVSRGTAMVLANLGMIALTRREFGSARNHFTDTLALMRALPSSEDVLICLHLLGQTALEQRDYDVAQQSLAECLVIGRDTKRLTGLPSTLAIVARLAGADCKKFDAAALAGAALALTAVPGNGPLEETFGHLEQFDKLVASLRSDLEPSVFDAAWEMGQTWTAEQALGHALRFLTDPA